MDSSTHPLLVPRVRVKADWPEMHQRLLQVGDILLQDGRHYRNARNSELTISVSDAARFPHLFEPLPWYAERKPGEMPKFLRKGDNVVVVVALYDFQENIIIANGCKFTLSLFMKGCTPATESDYNAYLQSKQEGGSK